MLFFFLSLSASLMVTLSCYLSLFSTGVRTTVLHIQYLCITCVARSGSFRKKYFSHSHTLTLTVPLPVTVPLQSLPPPFSQWCDGPHCGVVVILQSRPLFFFFFFPDAPQKNVSFSAHPSVRACSCVSYFPALQQDLKKIKIFVFQTVSRCAKNGANF